MSTEKCKCGADAVFKSLKDNTVYCDECHDAFIKDMPMGTRGSWITLRSTQWITPKTKKLSLQDDTERQIIGLLWQLPTAEMRSNVINSIVTEFRR